MNKYFFVIAFFCCANVSAQDVSSNGKSAWTDVALGTTMRFMAIQFVQKLDYDTIRMKKIDEFREWPEEDFARYYADVWPLIAGCGQRFGFTANMSKQMFLSELSHLTKPKVIVMIDSIPDAVIVAEFNKEALRLKGRIPEGSIDKQISWIFQEAERNLKQ